MLHIQSQQHNGEYITNPSQLVVQYQPELRAVWYSMSPEPRPCFNPALLQDLTEFRNAVQCHSRNDGSQSFWSDVQYTVAASMIPGVFSFGGDLNLFRDCIVRRDAAALHAYAIRCVDLLFSNYSNFDRSLTTISLVQGDAMGGGMEMALSSSVVIAERSAKFGLPEILFGLFPGMGAYQLLSQRIGMIAAERFITSGRIYSASEMLTMGLIDVVVDDGAGPHAVTDYIRRQQSASHAYRALNRVRRIANRVTREELDQVVDVWVDCAMQLDDKQLRVMQRIARAQDRLMTNRPERVAESGVWVEQREMEVSVA